MNPNVLRRLPALMLAAVGGGLLYLAFPNPGIWPFAYIGIAFLVGALGRGTMPWAFFCSFVFHLAFFLPLLWWAYFSVGALPWVALSVAESLIMGLLGPLWVAMRRALRLARWPLAGSLLFAVLYAGLEGVRSAWPFGGFPWGRLSFSQAEAPLAALARLGGQPLVTLAVALSGAAIAYLWLAAWARGPFAVRADARPTAGRVRAATAAGIVVLITVLAPAVIPLPTGPESGTLAVGAVQGNIADSSHGAETRMRGVIENHVKGTKELAEKVGKGTLDIVLWPENSADISPRADEDVAKQIDSAARAAGAPILVGAVEFFADGTRANVSLLWAPGEGVIDEYAKQHPAPFAEYIPMRSFVRLFTDKVELVTNEMVPGDKPATIRLPVARLGREVTLADVICFEVAYDDIVNQGVALGGELIVVPTNNASFGFTNEGAQQLAMTRMRAIEHGRAAVQISTVGLSGIVSPDGRLLQSGGLFTAEQFDAVIPLRTSLTWAVRVSGPLDVACMVAAGLAAAASVVVAVQSRRRRA